MPRSPSITRRALLQSAAACALGGPALAQAAAHHRFSLGVREIVVLSDGHLVVPTDVLAANIPRTELASFLAARAVGPHRVHFHINVALVKTGSDYLLID